MVIGRNLYKAVVVLGVVACALGAGLALWSAEVVNALVCVVLGCLLVATHLNHVSSVGQFTDLGGRIDRGLQSLGLGLLDRVDRSNEKLEASIVQIDKKAKDLISKQIEMKTAVIETQTTMIDILRRVKISHKAVATAEDELAKHVIGKSAMTLLAMREMQSSLERSILSTKDQIDSGVNLNVSGLLKEISSSEDRLGRATIEVQDVITKNGQALRRQIDQRYDSLRVQLERSPGELAGLMSVANDLLLDSTDVPLLGGWAVSAPTLTALLKEIGRNPGVENVVECGSGASTIWCGLACRKRGHGHVYALEHDPKFAEVTRKYITRNGLDPWVTVVDAPLIPYVVEGVEYRWYSLQEIEGVEKIDLLFVDGPPGETGPMARYPAFQLLAPRLSENAWVVLDDTVRKEERDIAAMWCEGQAAGLKLTLLQELPKSMILIAKRSLGA
ncbi:class I SAM-dependent methyltransferase [Lysobacter sp. A378]